MGEAAHEIIRRLHGNSPYKDFPYQQFPLDLKGGRKEPILLQLVDDLRAQVVIEVGTWKGATAIWLATHLNQRGADATVICVDTWLGSIEHWEGSVQGWDIRPHLRHGYPTLYYQFLANVVHSRCEDLIVPIPNTSANAARWLAHQRIVADLVYIDGSHEEEDVYRDVCSYWKLLRPGGVLVGDDWQAYWFGVICAVNRFARENDLPIQIAGSTWILRKPALKG